ncbi:MAG: tRNA pseudouridine(38-40) synthase TruA [Hyphomicrobiales bacterium]
MPRYRITLEYDGAPYCGWQAQANGPSVQSAVEAALVRLTGEDARLYGAGRTDSGVHATAQVAHFDLGRAWTGKALRDGLNAHLRPAPVAVLDAAETAPDFHARFSATGRRYLYRIINRHVPLALERDRAWWVRRPLDAEAMHAAAQRLVGHHDFTTFRSIDCQSASPVKTLDHLAVTRRDEEIQVVAAARSFLHNQVRSLVGSLKLVGQEKWSAEDLTAALAARDRRACGPVAPAHGLYLVAVEYGASADQPVDREA